GLHRARGPKGYSRGMYSYDYLMDFHAGATTVFCEVIVGNNFPKSVGAPCFEDASLWMKLRGPVVGCSIAGHKGEPQAATLAKGESICLYQDSNGADTWQRCQGYNTERRPYWRFPPGKTASFRGYEVRLRRGPAADRIGGGDQAVGTTHVRTDRGGLIVHLPNFWQQFPKGVEVFADGRLRVALFPREYKVRHFLEDASAKGHEIVLHFYAKGADGGRPDARRMAEIWSAKTQPRPADVRHIAAAGYDGLEISAIKGMCEHLEVERWKEQKADLQKIMQDNRLEFLSMELGKIDDEERILRAFDAGAEIGVPVINVGPGGESGDTESRKARIEILARLAEKAESVGVTLCVK
ncbi:hypothetical protein LCGC14_3063400, partial [marine sediment metagenome]